MYAYVHDRTPGLNWNFGCPSQEVDWVSVWIFNYTMMQSKVLPRFFSFLVLLLGSVSSSEPDNDRFRQPDQSLSHGQKQQRRHDNVHNSYETAARFLQTANQSAEIWLEEYPTAITDPYLRTQLLGLATLYYATSGPFSWINNSSWLSNDTDDCVWYNKAGDLACFADGTMVNLDLSQNGLDGTLPTILGSLTFLGSLSLENNPNLTGTLISELGNLRELRILQLNGADFFGTLPSEWAIHPNLLRLQLGQNAINGSLPEVYGNMIDLVELDLNTNQISSYIPESFGQLVSLQSLNLSWQRYLHGTIPLSIWLLPSLFNLEVEYNYLEGTLPPELGLSISLLAINIKVTFGLMDMHIHIYILALLQYSHRLSIPSLLALSTTTLMVLFHWKWGTSPLSWI